ncbi:hypothetical protein A2U01_0069544, partial [Trifolium medium]|nr:hypothetical protein [Trifolium medium]
MPTQAWLRPCSTKLTLEKFHTVKSVAEECIGEKDLLN